MDIYKYSFLDIIPYFIVLWIVLFLTFGYKRKDKSLFIAIVLFVFSAIRYGVGYDYFNYVNIMQYNTHEMEFLSQYIIDFAIFCKYPHLFFVINAFISIFCIYFTSKKLSVNPAISLLLLYLIPVLYLESFSIVRNFTSYSLVLLSAYYLIQRKWVIYVFLIISAGFFHYSGFIGFLLIIPFFFKINRTFAIILFLSAFFISEFLLDYILQINSSSTLMLKLLGYANNSKELGRFMKFFILLLNGANLIFWNRLCTFNKLNKFYLNAVNIGACFWFVFGFDHTLSLRLSSFFLIFDILLIPSYFHAFSYKYNLLVNQCIILLFISVYISGFIININNYLSSFEKMSYIPYQTIFFHKDYSNYK